MKTPLIADGRDVLKIFDKREVLKIVSKLGIKLRTYFAFLGARWLKNL